MTRPISRAVTNQTLIDADHGGYRGELRKLYRFKLSCGHTVERWCIKRIPGYTQCDECEALKAEAK